MHIVRLFAQWLVVKIVRLRAEGALDDILHNVNAVFLNLKLFSLPNLKIRQSGGNYCYPVSTRQDEHGVDSRGTVPCTVDR